jgi:hypothetical protein
MLPIAGETVSQPVQTLTKDSVSSQCFHTLAKGPSRFEKPIHLLTGETGP